MPPELPPPVLPFAVAAKQPKKDAAATGVVEPIPGKFGLYPLGSDDVVMSLQLFSTIIGLLEDGGPELRIAMADQLRAAYKNHFVG